MSKFTKSFNYKEANKMKVVIDVIYYKIGDINGCEYDPVFESTSEASSWIDCYGVINRVYIIIEIHKKIIHYHERKL